MTATKGVEVDGREGEEKATSKRLKVPPPGTAGEERILLTRNSRREGKGREGKEGKWFLAGRRNTTAPLMPDA